MLVRCETSGVTRTQSGFQDLLYKGFASRGLISILTDHQFIVYHPTAVTVVSTIDAQVSKYPIKSATARLRWQLLLLVLCRQFPRDNYPEGVLELDATVGLLP